MSRRITIAVAELTMQELISELAIVRQDILRLEPTNARALDTIRQAAKAIMTLCDMAEKQRDLIYELSAQADNTLSLLQSKEQKQ